MFVSFLVIFLLILGGLGLWLYRRSQSSVPPLPPPQAVVPNAPKDHQISYAPPQFEWSGNSTNALPIKTLSYKQYECLEDARYGFRIVGLPPSERKQAQPPKPAPTA